MSEEQQNPPGLSLRNSLLAAGYPEKDVDALIAKHELALPLERKRARET